jgi:DNA repair protein RadC
MPATIARGTLDFPIIDHSQPVPCGREALIEYAMRAVGRELPGPLAMLFVDENLQLVAADSVNGLVSAGRIAMRAAEHGASGVILVRRQPFGKPVATADDVRLASRLADMGRHFDTQLLDFIVISPAGPRSRSILGPAVS